MTDPTPEEHTPRPLAERVKALGRQGRNELTRPGGLGDSAHGLFRRWFRKVWESRGGGLYAVGFAVTFLILEVRELFVDDIPKLMSINLLSGELISFVVQFFVDTFLNMVQAFMWPVTMIQWRWPVGIICLGVGYALFPRFVQQPLEHWLFEGEPPPPKAKKKPRGEQTPGG